MKIIVTVKSDDPPNKITITDPNDYIVACLDSTGKSNVPEIIEKFRAFFSEITGFDVNVETDSVLDQLVEFSEKLEKIKGKR